MKYKWYFIAFFLAISASLLIINIAKSENLISQVDQCQQYKRNVDYRISELARINSRLLGFDFRTFSDVRCYHEDSMEPVASDTFRSKYILIFTQSYCPDCIETALSRYHNLYIDQNPNIQHDMIIMGSYINPSAFKVYVENSGFSISNIFYSSELASSFAGDEEIPMLLYVDTTGVVAKACFLDHYLPDNFYSEFVCP